jgi:hypothetical protein
MVKNIRITFDILLTTILIFIKYYYIIWKLQTLIIW